MRLRLPEYPDNKRTTILSVLLILLITSIVMFRQLTNDMYFSCITPDTLAYTSWAVQFIEALKEGIAYPRWLPLNFWGYGSPTFILYSPFAFYLTAFFNIFLDSVISAMNVAKFTALFISGVGVFFLVKEVYSNKIGIMASVFYIIFPYNILQFYFFGSFANTISFMWFAPIMLFAYRYFKNGQYKYLILSGTCYGGLIFTHLINAYMFALVIATFIIYMCIINRRSNNLIAIPAIVITGILISAAYFLPLLYEKNFIALDASVQKTSGAIFSDFFILPDTRSKFSDDHFWQIYYDTFLFHVIFLGILILLFFLQMKKIKGIEAETHSKIITKFFFGLSAGSLFFLFGISAFIWELMPFFRFIQFPIRWLNITTFSVVFMSAAMFYRISQGYKSPKNLLLVVIIFFICIFLDFKYINSAPMFERTELLPVKGVNWTLEHLPTGVDVDNIDKDEHEQNYVDIIKGRGKLDIIRWNSSNRIFHAVAEEDIILKIKTFNFPGWTANINGSQIEIKTEEKTGSMVIAIPEGQHVLELNFTDTPVRHYGKIISFFSFIILLAIFILELINKSQTKLMSEGK